MAYREVEAVVFDSDGTLVRTPDLVIAAYGHVAEQHGLVPRTREEIMVYMGQSLREIYIGLYPDQDPDVLMATNSEYFLANIHTAGLYPDVESTLKRLRQAGLELAVVSGGNHKTTDVLEHHRIAQYFTSVVHSERITQQKPHPEGIELALRECGGIATASAVVVGDMLHDIETGRNAGALATVGVTHGFGTREQLEQAGAGYVIDMFSEFPDVLATIEAR